MLYVGLGPGFWYLKLIKFGEPSERKGKGNDIYKIRPRISVGLLQVEGLEVETTLSSP